MKITNQTIARSPEVNVASGSAQHLSERLKVALRSDVHLSAADSRELFRGILQPSLDQALLADVSDSYPTEAVGFAAKHLFYLKKADTGENYRILVMQDNGMWIKKWPAPAQMNSSR